MPLFRDAKSPPLQRWPEPAQTVGFAASALFINFVIGLMISPLGYWGANEVKEELVTKHGHFFTFFLLVIVAPFTETIYGQWLPIFVAKIAKRTRTMQIVWASVWFALLHLPDGFIYTLQNFGVGWVLASAFLFSRQESWLKAYRVTSISHAIHNLVVYLLV